MKKTNVIITSILSIAFFAGCQMENENASEIIDKTEITNSPTSTILNQQGEDILETAVPKVTEQTNSSTSAILNQQGEDILETAAPKVTEQTNSSTSALQTQNTTENSTNLSSDKQQVNEETSAAKSDESEHFTVTVPSVVADNETSSADTSLELNGTIKTNSNVDVSNIKVDIFSSELKKSEDNVMIYEHTYEYSVYTDEEGRYSFTKPSEYCLVQIDLNSIPIRTGVDKQSFFIDYKNDVTDFTIDEIADVEISDINNITVYDEVTKFRGQGGKYFIVLNVTPQKIYWNDYDEYDVAVGQPIDIAIPAIFEDWVSDADEIMICMNSRTFSNLSLSLNGDEKIKIKGIRYDQYWSMDYLCPIKDGIMYFGEYTDEIKNSFDRIDVGVYIEEANYYYSENPFENNMTVDNLDIYFETLKADTDALFQKIAADPYSDYDIAGFWGYQDGFRMRAKINKIY